VFVGGIFCALGLTLSYFATSLIHLLFTFGVLTGKRYSVNSLFFKYSMEFSSQALVVGFQPLPVSLSSHSILINTVHWPTQSAFLAQLLVVLCFPC
jgi:hypothetical protein